MLRRDVLKALGAAGGLLATPAFSTGRVWAAPIFRRDPFALGIASGDPLPEGVVLWTRLAPDPLSPDGGMPMQPVEVKWSVARDRRMRDVVRAGTAMAWPELAHAVHVEVDGLEPGRDYWYRFQVGAEASLVGRTRTAPAPGTLPDRLRFAVGGCQNYQDGLFTALRHMSEESFDFVYHYGDYIYEGGQQRYAIDPRTRAPIPPVRTIDAQECFSLSDYRLRHALYKSDLDLQAAHAAAPWVVTFDDHEIDNNWAAGIDESGTPPEVFLLRRAAALQAFYEHLPLRRASMPAGGGLRLHRRLSFGALLDLHVLDTRQYRTDQPCGDEFQPHCAGRDAPTATLLGREQRDWLFNGLRNSRARWNALAQQVMMAQINQQPWMAHIRTGDRVPPLFNMDAWDGYRHERKRLFDLLDDHRLTSTVVLTGDTHNGWASDLRSNFDDPKSRVLATEFGATSIASGGDGADTHPWTAAMLDANRHVRFFSDRRGYLACEVTPAQWRADFRVVDRVGAPGGKLSTSASFVVDHGRPGAQRA